jgi:serine/threonine-protein kinase
LLGQVLSALEAVHGAGIVHADIKTANVLVETTDDGALLARVIDFGLARFLDDPSNLDVRVLSGTPDYLAPELVQGGVPSVASDIYAAGVVLYELLTGTTPFGGGTCSEIMNRHVNDDVVLPTLRCPDLHISRAIEAAIMRALAKQPSRRFTTVAEFAAALEGVPTSARNAPRQFPRGTLPIVAFSSEATTRNWLRELRL